MPDTFKTLAQLNPALNTLKDLYTVPADTQVTTSSIVICNQAGASGTFRISIAIAGVVDAVKQYLYYDQPINNTFIATIGITLRSTDVVRAYASNGSMSFNLFGVETT